MPESFYNSQYFMIYSRVILLHIFELLTIIHYKVKVFDSLMFLEKHGTKLFSAGIGLYFHLSVCTTIVDF